jgi:hypothetical protein
MSKPAPAARSKSRTNHIERGSLHAESVRACLLVLRRLLERMRARG